MDLRQEILGSPQALRQTLEKGRPEFQALVRRTRWGEGPVYMAGNGPSFLSALAGAYAFETLLGWPVVARRAKDFAAYSLPLLRPRSVLLAVSRSGETEATVEVARAARAQGAHVLALTHQPTSSLASMAEGAFLVRGGEEARSGVQQTFCQQVALTYIALIAARAFQRHHPQLDALETDLENLPDQVEWVLTQLSDAAAALAAALTKPRTLYVAGAGFYHPTALQAAGVFGELGRLPAQGRPAEEFLSNSGLAASGETAALFVCGSRCRARKTVHQAAARAGRSGAQVFAVTDSNDRELSEAASVAVLLPLTTEPVGSALALAFLQAVACQAAGGRGRPGVKGGSETRRGA